MDSSKLAGIKQNMELLGLAEPPKSDGATSETTSPSRTQSQQSQGSHLTSDYPQVGINSSHSGTPQLFPWRFNLDATDLGRTETRHEEAAGELQYIDKQNQNPRSLGGISSEAGRSDCSFLSIVPIQDMGHSAHIEWESSEIANDACGVGIEVLPSTSLVPQPQENANDYVDVQTMSDAMIAASITSASDDMNFLPLDALRRIVTPSAVQRLLGHAFPHFKPKVINSWVSRISGEQDEPKTKVQPKRRKIFAILILMEQVQLIEDFIKNGIDDKNLPLEIKRNAKQKPFIQLQTQEGCVLSCFNHWRTKHVNDFVQNQQTICTPFFKLPGAEVHYYEIKSKTILPFEKYDLVQIGGYGSVRKVRIHCAHYSRDVGSKVRGEL
ncbi:hypothetical protein CORC01_06757 [Colletotrichum orchidophilum]|uniref:Uncharacterized protein n=1 Tax=Colletotrichum orchidophilum TaxID=1209926 RepID=A0A1G4B900_9PEZI|nr:uncharacterized protein CORC01_06757 [Colletotrichum orchidophilum]OHE97894.1 hypothetical protein CORC01_06757 [Colletotrichum orchidophilum]